MYSNYLLVHNNNSNYGIKDVCCMKKLICTYTVFVKKYILETVDNKYKGSLQLNTRST